AFLRLEQYLRPQALTTWAAYPGRSGRPPDRRVRHSARDETNTAARTHRVLRSTFQRTPFTAARSSSFDPKNNAASTRARSRHRSGMLAVAHTQKASRNLQSSAPRQATRTVVFGA